MYAYIRHNVTYHFRLLYFCRMRRLDFLFFMVGSDTITKRPKVYNSTCSDFVTQERERVQFSFFFSQNLVVASLIHDFHDLNPRQTHKRTIALITTFTFTWEVTLMLHPLTTYIRNVILQSGKNHKAQNKVKGKLPNGVMREFGMEKIRALLSALTEIQGIPGNWISEPLFYAFPK